MDKQHRIQHLLGSAQAYSLIKSCCFYFAAEGIFRRRDLELTGS